MNRGGSPNINGAPVDEMAPNYPQKSTKDLIDKAMDIPAFAKKYGKLMADRFSFVATQEANKAASRAASAPRSSASDAKLKATAQDGPKEDLEEVIEGLQQVQENNAAIMAALSGEQVSEVAADGWMPRGLEQTPFDETTELQRGEAQRSNAMPHEVPARSPGHISEARRGAVDALLPRLADSVAALFFGIRARGGLPRVKPTVRRPDVTTKGIRGMDAATRRNAMDAAKASDKEWLTAEGYMSKAGVEVPYRWEWDSELGIVRPRRD